MTISRAAVIGNASAKVSSMGTSLMVSKALFCSWYQKRVGLVIRSAACGKGRRLRRAVPRARFSTGEPVLRVLGDRLAVGRQSLDLTT